MGARTNSRGVGGHQRPYQGQTDTWLTPPEIVEALGRFDLDPCAAPHPRPWFLAEENWSLPEADGLSRGWFGRVWLNPPYGPATGMWLERLAWHGTGTALIFARTETQMFFEQVWERADGLLFLRRRLHHHRWPDGRRTKLNAGAPSVLVAYGAQDLEALKTSGLDGRVVQL